MALRIAEHAEEERTVTLSRRIEVYVSIEMFS
jgi:hypothetical protein